MPSLDTFKTRTSLTVGADTVSIYSLPALEREFPGVARLPYLAQDPAREPAAPRRQRVREDRRTFARWRRGIRRRSARRKCRSCRRACCCRTSPACPASSTWRRCATASSRSAAIRRRSTRCSRSSSSSITRCRSITSARPTRSALNADLEYHRNRERYVFLRWGQTAFRNFRVVPPETGIVHQVNIEYLARVVCREDARRRRDRVSRHGVRHRLAHDDGERPGRGGMGRRRHRSGGRDARPAELDADSAGARLSPDGQAARRRDRDRPGADDHRSAPQEGRGRQVRRVLRSRARAPDDCRSRHARQHVPRVRRHRRDLPDRRHDARVPAADRPRRQADRAGRGLREGAGPVPHGRLPRKRSTAKRWSSIWRRWSRASPVRAVRRIACRCRRPSRRLPARSTS